MIIYVILIGKYTPVHTIKIGKIDILKSVIYIDNYVK